MSISKKTSFITIFSMLLSTSLTILPLWSNSQSGQLQNPLSSIINNHKNLSLKDIKDSMSDQAKLIVGVGTVGLGGIWLASKLTKHIIGLGLCAGGLYIVGTVGTSLFNDIKDPKQTLSEIKDDVSSMINNTVETFNKTKDDISEIITAANDISNKK